MKVFSLIEGIVLGMTIVVAAILMMPRKYFNKMKRLRRKTNKSMTNLNEMIEKAM